MKKIVSGFLLGTSLLCAKISSPEDMRSDYCQKIQSDRILAETFLEVQKKQYGLTHEDIMQGIDLMSLAVKASLLVGAGKISEAEPFLKEVLEIFFGENTALKKAVLMLGKEYKFLSEDTEITPEWLRNTLFKISREKRDKDPIIQKLLDEKSESVIRIVEMGSDLAKAILFGIMDKKTESELLLNKFLTVLEKDRNIYDALDSDGKNATHEVLQMISMGGIVLGNDDLSKRTLELISSFKFQESKNKMFYVRSYWMLGEKDKAKEYLLKALTKSSDQDRLDLVVSFGEFLEDLKQENVILRSIQFNALSDKGKINMLDKVFSLQDDDFLFQIASPLIEKIYSQSFLNSFDERSILLKTKCVVKILELASAKGDRKKAIRIGETLIYSLWIDIKLKEEINKFISKTNKELGFFGRWNPRVK